MSAADGDAVHSKGSDVPLAADRAGNDAPRRRRVLAQAAWEARTLLSNGEQLLLSVVLPALALLGLTFSDQIAVPSPAGLARVDVVTPGVLALAVISTSFTGQAITTAFDRRRGVLRLLATTPLGPAGLLIGRVIAVAAVLVAQSVVLGGVAVAVGWRPELSGWWLALLAATLGTTCFTALGMLLGGTMRPEAVLALANLAWVLFAAFGVLIPPGDGLAHLAGWLPSGALADLLRAALADVGSVDRSLMVLTGWAVVSVAAAVRWFRWDD